MSKKIQVEAFYGAHYHAGCMVCQFAAGIRTDKTPTAQDVRKAVKKHVRETGHECWIESGTTWHYSLLSTNASNGESPAALKEEK